MCWVKPAPGGGKRGLRCGVRNGPGVWERYRCRACKTVPDRDMNAAINMLPA